MNELTIPPSAIWYRSNSLECTPDNTLVYAARRDIIIIKYNESNEPNDIKIIPNAHTDKVTCLTTNNITWGEPDKLIISAGDDNIVRIWDAQDFSVKTTLMCSEKSVDLFVAVMYTTDRVVCVTAKGTIVIWRVSTDREYIFRNLCGRKVLVRCAVMCPHATYLAAIGLESGTVSIVDLRQNGKLLFQLNADNMSICNLSWCPAPMDIYKTKYGRPVMEMLNSGKIIISGQKKNYKTQIAEILKTETESEVGDFAEPDIQTQTAEILKTETESEPDIIVDFDTIESLVEINVNSEEDKVTTELEKPENDTKNQAIYEKDLKNESFIRTLEANNIFNVEVPYYDMSSRKNTLFEKIHKTNVWAIPDEEIEINTMENDEEFRYLEECIRTRKIILAGGDNLLTNNLQKENFQKDSSVDIELKMEPVPEESAKELSASDQDNIALTATESSVVEQDKIALAAPESSVNEQDNSTLIATESSVDEQDNILIAKDSSLDEQDNIALTAAKSSLVEQDNIDSIVKLSELTEQDNIEASAKDLSEVEQNVESTTVVEQQDKIEAIVKDSSVVAQDNASTAADSSSSEPDKLEPTIKEEQNDIELTDKVSLIQKYVDDYLKEYDFARRLMRSKTYIKPPFMEQDNVETIKDEQDDAEPFKDLHNDVPIKDEQNDNEENREEGDTGSNFLLAACNKAGVVYIWNATTSGKCIAYLIPPGCDKTNKHKKVINSWASVCWAKPDILISTDVGGNVFCWDLLPTVTSHSKKNNIFKSRLLHNYHNKKIFNAKVPFKLYPNFERTASWDSLNDICVWTTSMDQWILCTSLGNNRSTLAAYPCFSGKITCIAASPIDPSKIAIGDADSSMRIFDLNKADNKLINMSIIEELYRYKMCSLDWHPIIENVIGFVTFEGQVGEYSFNSIKSLKYYCQKKLSLYHIIQWGPLPEKENEFALYYCCNGEFLYFEHNSSFNDPVELTIEDSHITTFSWNPDYKSLAIGTKQGHVKLLTPQFATYQTFYMQKKTIHNLAWHPIATTSDNGVSPFRDYLAVATCEQVVYVYNCQNVYSDGDGVSDLSDIVVELKGHSSGVKCVAWNPHISGRLACLTEHFTIHIWDVATKTLLSSHKNSSRDSFNSFIWSPIHPDYIIAGGKDSTFKIFHVDNYSSIYINQDKKKTRKKKVQIIDDTQVTDTTKRVLTLPIITKVHNAQNRLLETCRQLMELQDEFNEDTEYNMDLKISPDAPHNPLGLFGSNEDMKRILSLEVTSYVNKKQWESATNVSLLKGDLGNMLEQALKSGTITPNMINFAPMVSYKLWKDMCLKYAEQLIMDSDHITASYYYLLGHQILKAIDVLRQGNHFREALAVAKCRLPPKDPIILDIYDEWSNYCLKTGMFEIAAQCFIRLRKLSEAASVLMKRDDEEHLSLALDLATKDQNHDLISAIKAKLASLNQQDSKEVDSPIALLPIHDSRLSAIFAKAAQEIDADEKVEEQEYFELELD